MPTSIKKLAPHIVLMIYVALILIPFVIIVFSSLKQSNAEVAAHPLGFPKELFWGNFAKAWKVAKINVYFWNSLYISTSAAVASVLLAAATSFALMRMKFARASKYIYQFVLIGMLIPGNVLFIAQYILMKDFGILDKHLALFLPYTAGALPFSILLISAFMKSVPSELEEAAIVDGLGSVGIFARIILPLTLPALVTVFIVNYLGNWNEYLLANFFISSDSLKTLPTGMVSFREAFQTNYPLLTTGILYSVVPVIILYGFLQKKIIEGLTAGSVKG